MSTTSRLAGYRERRDEFFRSHENSPLTEAQRETFAGLRYFPENPELSFTLAIDDSGPGVGETITVGTLSGEAKEYVRAGRIHFEADGQPVTLSVFKDKERGRYFMPFRDGTAGEECYAVGRYLDPKARPDGSLVVDFNLAYIPSTFTAKLAEPFDTAYMKELFQVGYDMAVKGYPWEKAPPGFSGLQVVPTQTGTFQGKCAELCGAYHSNMLFNVRVVEQDEYDAHMQELADRRQTGLLGSDLNMEEIMENQRELLPEGVRP